MVNKILLSFLALDFLFAATGGLLIGTVFLTKAAMANQTKTNVAANMLLMQTPLTGVIVNGALIFLTFLISLPGVALSTNRLWLRMTGLMIVICAHVTLLIGIIIWFSTLQTRANLGHTFAKQTPLNQSLIQQKFHCCGYLNNPPTLDNVCTSTFVASQKVDCVGPFSNFANGFLDLIFTAMFGIVGLDMVFLLAVVVVLKDRAEKERYRHIDEKNGIHGGI